IPGGNNGTPKGVEIPVPGIGTVRAGTTPNGGVSVGKNLNVAGVKDLWDLTVGPNGASTTDRIGTDTTNVFVDAAAPLKDGKPHL
ncbi:hypothetical protein C6401_16690, partial [Arthrobacter woluwensis]|uniref:hypothetical protein n=2 Tax=Arthrobacter TaxID=1663 RepID=UPI000D4747C8